MRADETDVDLLVEQCLRLLHRPDEQLSDFSALRTLRGADRALGGCDGLTRSIGSKKSWMALRRN